MVLHINDPIDSPPEMGAHRTTARPCVLQISSVAVAITA